ncbi:hypothetical protein OKW21_004597 [Catalinimonas alkaloidigena]|uniref:heparinase II/III domain-containing protein n=1 Tax=Catalinimonas alkaloidigena TaxID=1075417 RepID=UPI002406BEC4|nr:heparinase II/III family protein [Catalinimonas alkaloidigena]MDF9799334.1 hypothetical protein [Catalinimonas alkaloidigena]
MKKAIVLSLCFMVAFQTLAEARDYFLYTDENITYLKNQINTDPQIKRLWDKNYKEARELLKKERLGANDCKLLGLVYRMTDETKYAEAIKKILQDYVSRETWESEQLLSRTPSWQGGLKTSHTSFYIAIGYDCIYDYLSAEERQQIAAEFVRVGIDPAREDWLLPASSFHTFDTMGHNWWSACVYMAGISALAVREEIPEATEWVREIAATASEWVNFAGSVLQNKPPTFDQDGGFYESVNYANYGVSQYLLFRYALQEVWPEEPQLELPVLDKIGDFFIDVCYYVKDGSVLSLPFGDTGILISGQETVNLLWKLGYQKERYAWYLKKVSQRDGNQKLPKLDSPEDLALLPDLPALPADYVPDMPTSHLYEDMGWASLRNSWEDNASLLAIKSGFTWNHAHADAGSFVIFHKGKYIITESGKSSYGNPLYTEYYCQSEAHNVVLFKGQGQNRRDPYYGVVNSGSLHNLLEGQNFKYVMANASGPYAHILARNYRHFIWVGDVILVIDDLLAHESGKFEHLIHYNGESERNGRDLSIKDGESEVLVRPLFPETFPVGGLPHDFPEQIRLEEKLGYKDHHPEERQPYWSISPAEETQRTKFITAILLKTDDNQDQLPEIERFQGDNFIGVSITQDNETTELYFNLKADGRLKHRNSVNDMNGWETDAYLTVLKFDEGADKSNPDHLKEVFIGHGSYLRRDSQVLMHALSKYTALVEDINGKAEVIFQGQDEATFRLRSIQPVSDVKLNNRVVPGVYDEDSQMVKLVVEN